MPEDRMSLYEQEERLLAAHEAISEAMEAGEEVPAAMLAVVEEYATSLAEKRDACAAVLMRLDEEADYALRESKRLKTVAEKRQAASDRLREMILTIMRSRGLDKVKGKTTTFTVIQNPPSVEVVDLTAIPADYRRVVPESWTPDKAAIKADLMDGGEVPGAVLKPGGYRLQVRS